jgi:phosphoglycolate phosphatase-like HAD superfamily hydrolase
MHKNAWRVLLFDIDGTLLDPAGEGRVCLRRALEDVFGLTGPVDTYDMAGKTDWQIVTDLMSAAGIDAKSIEASLPAVFAAYARYVEITAPTFKMRALPGVLDLVTQLSADSRFILGLVTGNVRSAVPHKLRAVGLEPGAFTFGAFGSEHHDRNQLPALALYRLEQNMGVPIPTETALVIGDTPHDIACARHTGLRVLCVATGTYPHHALASHNPDYLLDDLADTQGVMEILRSF